MKNACIGSLGILLSLTLGLGCSATTDEGADGVSLYANSRLAASRLSGIPANGDAQVTFTFTLLNDVSQPVPGIDIAIQATGERNTLDQEQTTTDENGVVTATLRSREAEAKVISVVRLVDDEEVETLENSATVYFGDLFGESQRFALGESPRGLAIADFDGDGLDDVATAAANEDGVSILSGEVLSDPELVQSFSSQEVGLGPSDVGAADVDGDGDIDVVSANQNENSITVLSNRGAGTFLREDFPAGEGPRKLLLVDVNGDDSLDVVTLNNGTDASDRISVLLGDGGGNFGDPAYFATGEGPTSLASGDVDGDGNLDLVVSNATDANVLVLLGNGAGSFAAGGTFETGPSPQKAALGDLDGDGFLDLVVGNDDNTFPVSVLMGEGDGNFLDQVNPPVGSLQVRDLILADVNGDGNLDAAYTHGDEFSVLLGDGWGTFDEPLTFATEGTTADTLSAKDVSGDGVLDMMVANRGSSNLSFFTLADAFSVEITGQCDATPHAFAANVAPIFSREGCTGCHGETEPDGGMNLASGDLHATLLAGRVDLATPQDSKILTKPTGQVNHGGNTQFTRSSEAYRTLFCWIEAGALND